MDARRRCSRLGTRTALTSRSAAPLFFCQPDAAKRPDADLPPRTAEPFMKRGVGVCSATRGLEPCTIPEEAPSMHCPGSDPSHAQRRRNIEPVYSATADFTSANPGVSRPLGRPRNGSGTASVRRGERGEASPCLAPLGEGVQCEGAHRTRVVRREGTPNSSTEGAAEDPPRRQGDAQAQWLRASHDDPQDRLSPVCTRKSACFGKPNPFGFPDRKIPRRSSRSYWMQP